MLGGIRIIESLNLVAPGPNIEAPRTWKERLFTLPWRPFNSSKTVATTVPVKDAIVLPTGEFLMHPETASYLRKELKQLDALAALVGEE